MHGKVLILSVDDEATNHMVLEEAIRCLGYNMHQVNGRTLQPHWRFACALLVLWTFSKSHALLTIQMQGQTHKMLGQTQCFIDVYRS